jgi:AbiV family abortive infection protein
MKSNNPIKPDYKEGYKHTLNNSKRLFDSAVLLAEEKHYYSIANSLLILSAEEAVKAFSLFHSYLFPNLLIENFEQLFFKHPFKHELAKSIIFIAGIAEGLTKNDLTNFNIDKEIIWFEKANNSKNNGFYVGMDFKTGKLSLHAKVRRTLILMTPHEMRKK